MLEYLILTTGGYVAGSIANALLKTPEPHELTGTSDKPVEGFTLYSIDKHQEPPVYIGGNNAMVPVGGGAITTQYNRVYSIFNSASGIHYKNYAVTPGEEDDVCKDTFVNNMDQLNVLVQRYSASNHVGSFPISLPMRAREYRWPQCVYIDGHSGFIGPNRHAVRLEARLARRLPLTGAAAAVCALGIGWYCLPANWKPF